MKVNIHYFFAHNAIRNLLFENYIKLKQLLVEGPEAV